MSDASERFLDLATKPLGGNCELHANARWEIGSKLKADAGEALEEATKRLARSDQTKRKRRWICLVLLVFGFALLGFGIMTWLPRKSVAALMLGLGHYNGFPEDLQNVAKQRHQALSSNGDLLVENPFEKTNSPLPTDPAAIAAYYWNACKQEQLYSEKPSLKLLERVVQVDPENGWWHYATASNIAARIDIRSAIWNADDEQTVNLMLRLYHQAATCPRFDSYDTALRTRMIALRQPAKTVEDCLFNDAWVRRRSEEFSSFMPDLLCAVIQKQADRKDQSAFNGLLSDWLKVSRRETEGINHFEDQAAVYWSFQRLLRAFLSASKNLDLNQEIQAIEASLEKLDELRNPSRLNKSNKRAYWLHGSYLLFLNSPCTYMCSTSHVDYFHDRYPTMTAERLKPNRRSEHAFTARLLTQPLAVMVLAVSALLFLFRFRHGRICRETSVGLAGLFDRSDWIHCLGIGVILPTAYFALIRYLSPFGGMDWFASPTRSLRWFHGATTMDWIVGDNDFLLERARFLLLFLLIVSCSLLVFRRRLRARMDVFEIPPAKDWIGGGWTIAGFVALPLLGSCYQVEQDRFVRLDLTLLYPCLALMGAMVIWLAVLALRFLFGNPEQALRRQILSRLLAQAMIWAFAVVCATIPLHMAEERFWVKRDTVLRADPEHPATTRYEWEVIQQMKGELLEVLAPLEAISR